MYPKKESDWIPKVITCSALNNIGIDDIYRLIEEYIALTKKNGYFQMNRNKQNKDWLFETINIGLKNQFYKDKKVQDLLKLQLKKIENQEINPFQAAKEILKTNR